MNPLVFAGAVLLTMLSALPAHGQARWTARLNTQIGDVDGPGALAEVWDVEVGRNGEIYVAQPRIATISVFSPTGKLLRTIGKKGQGPGEFQTIGRTGWVGDTLWAMNFRSLNLFTADGQFIRKVNPAALPTPARGIDLLMPGPVLKDGSIMLIPISNVTAVMNGDITTAAVLRVTQAGAIADTLAIVSIVGSHLAFEIQGRRMTAMHPYPDNPLWMNTADGQGLVIVDRKVRGTNVPRSFRVVRTNLRGDTVASKVHAYAGIRMTSAWRNDFLQNFARARANGAPIAAVEKEVRAQIDLPETHTPVTELVPGRDGTIWLRREDTNAADVEWWVLDASGALLGAVRLPSKLKVYRADRQTVWGLAKDELDVPYIRVYTITR